jgi:Domain of Unknown Function (DUF326)
MLQSLPADVTHIPGSGNGRGAAEEDTAGHAPRWHAPCSLGGVVVNTNGQISFQTGKTPREELPHMTYAAPLIQADPSKPPIDAKVIVECIQACDDCAQACIADANADLAEQQVQTMTRCIRLCLDCADVCRTTGAILSRQFAFDVPTARAVLQACALECKVCGDECEHHAQRGFAHCRTCMEACRRGEQACNAVLASLPR